MNDWEISKMQTGVVAAVVAFVVVVVAVVVAVVVVIVVVALVAATAAVVSSIAMKIHRCPYTSLFFASHNVNGRKTTTEAGTLHWVVHTRPDSITAGPVSGPSCQQTSRWNQAEFST